LWVTAALVAVAVIILFQTLTLSPVARLVPIAVLIPTLALFIFQMILDLRSENGESQEFESNQPPETSRSGALSLKRDSAFYWIGWLCGLLVGLRVLGFFFSLPLFVLIYLRVRSRESWSLVLTMVLVTLVLEYGLFSLLDIPMYEGWFWDFLRPNYG